MYVVVNHSISDPEMFKILSEIAPVPSHLRLLQSLPSADGTRAVCLWEGPGVEAVRSFVEDGVGAVSTNVYFAVRAARAVGLPVVA